VSSELARRVAFSVVAAPVAVAVIYFGDWPLATLLSAVAALGAWELFRIARAGGVGALEVIGIALAALLPLATHASRLGFTVHPVFGAVAVLAVLTVAIWARGVDGKPLAATAVTVFGALYTGGMLSFGYALRYHRVTIDAKGGMALLLLPVLLTWASDIGAYAVGRVAGRRKLIPSVSPGKTVEGAVGALVTCVVVCWLYVALVLRPFAQLTIPPAGIVLFALAISATAQIGDLAESLLKREAGVKDSSRIIPGHGGVLDRFDSLLFVLPVAYVLLMRRLHVPAPL
jgi:phosphatidate cytidylyltransferase